MFENIKVNQIWRTEAGDIVKIIDVDVTARFGIQGKLIQSVASNTAIQTWDFYGCWDGYYRGVEDLDEQVKKQEYPEYFL